MAHIHTEPGEIDRTVSVFIVYVPEKRVLLRLHDKHKIWLVPGGHIENYQTAIEAALAPQETNCLFYLHDMFGSTHCSETYEEHLENIDRFLR